MLTLTLITTLQISVEVKFFLKNSIFYLSIWIVPPRNKNLRRLFIYFSVDNEKKL